MSRGIGYREHDITGGEGWRSPMSRGIGYRNMTSQRERGGGVL